MRLSSNASLLKITIKKPSELSLNDSFTAEHNASGPLRFRSGLYLSELSHDGGFGRPKNSINGGTPTKLSTLLF